MEDDNGNGRITTAVLKQTVMDVDKKLDYITDKVDTLLDAAARYDERIKKNEDAIKSLSGRSNTIDGVVAAAAAIAAFLGLSR